jgi:hypothetical protein
VGNKDGAAVKGYPGGAFRPQKKEIGDRVQVAIFGPNN